MVSFSAFFCFLAGGAFFSAVFLAVFLGADLVALAAALAGFLSVDLDFESFLGADLVCLAGVFSGLALLPKLVSFLASFFLPLSLDSSFLADFSSWAFF